MSGRGPIVDRAEGNEISRGREPENTVNDQATPVGMEIANPPPIRTSVEIGGGGRWGGSRESVRWGGQRGGRCRGKREKKGVWRIEK